MVLFAITVFIIAFGAKNGQGRISSDSWAERSADQNRFYLIPSIYLPNTGIPCNQVVLKNVLLPRNLLESGFARTPRPGVGPEAEQEAGYQLMDLLQTSLGSTKGMKS